MQMYVHIVSSIQLLSILKIYNIVYVNYRLAVELHSIYRIIIYFESDHVSSARLLYYQNTIIFNFA